MFRRFSRCISGAIIGATLAAVSGCLNDHGNRAGDTPLVARASEARESVGKRVTVVGTAKMNDPTGASIEIRGGEIAMPEFDWPAKLVGRPVSATGVLLRSTNADRKHIYRLGEIERTERWSR